MKANNVNDDGKGLGTQADDCYSTQTGLPVASSYPRTLSRSNPFQKRPTVRILIPIRRVLYGAAVKMGTSRKINNLHRKHSVSLKFLCS